MAGRKLFQDFKLQRYSIRSEKHSVLTNIQGKVGRGFGQPDLLGGVPAHGKGTGMS